MIITIPKSTNVAVKVFTDKLFHYYTEVVYMNQLDSVG